MSFYDKIAALCVFIMVLKFMRFLYRVIYKQFLAPNFNAGLDFKRFGKWALVTGATDGIGKSYAKGLAQKGMGVVLVSRSIDKLNAVAEEIEKKFSVETRVIQADFSKAEEAYKVVEKNITELEIGVLVNNVGVSYPYPEFFLDMMKTNPDMDSNIVTCNIISVINMCKLVLPGMLERRKGAIINISSGACKIPSPLLTTYSATKSFVDKFTSDLAAEYGKCGIVFQSVLPGFVATKMAKIRKATWMAPSADTYVESALKTVGIEEHTYGYYPHILFLSVVQMMEYICDAWARIMVVKIMKKVRDRAIKKRTE